ncbi:MAG: hypothetical protein KGY99_04565 [Phycisphaerae bacterium]|nr:hypothetical protein [Phycisphaerae bacterium]
MNRIRRLIPVVLLAALACSVGACGELLGICYHVVNPPQSVDAVCTLPADQRICVFVEDAGLTGSHPVTRTLTEALNEQLETQDVAAETVSYRKLLNLSAAAPDFSTRRTVDIARDAGADLVCTVRITEFSLKDTDVKGVWKGKLAAVVDVHDVETGRRLGPGNDPEGYLVEPVELPMSHSTDQDYGAQLAQNLSHRMADRIAKLFYKHRVRPAEMEQ